MSKLINTFQVRFDDETKAEIASLKGKLDAVAHRLNVGHAMPTGGLLAVMAGEAANDSNSAIDRETINDVDYLSTSLDESVPYIDNAVEQNYWLSPSVPKITDADMQLIFIKNLSEVLIQRMHSMDRFSEDDYAVGGDKLMAWDIVIGKRFADVEDASEQDHQDEFAIVTGERKKLSSPQHDHLDVLILSKANVCEESTKIGGWATIYHETNDTYRAITEAELPAFRAALEACYA